jgi:zinc transport system ATP-binding protein
VDAVLTVSHLTVVLRGREVLSDLSFTVGRGESLGILGPNGAGKTVLLRTLLGLVPHAGTVTWCPGTRIGYVPQRVPYVRDLPVSVADFFTLERPRGVEVAALLQAVGLHPQLARQRMGVLSSGQFQRVLIAWALAGDPEVLLFDEPTAGVDVVGEETIHRTLARLRLERALTMLLVTHDLTVVRDLCTTVLCLNRAAISHGPPLEALTPEVMERMYGGPVAYHHHEAPSP